VARKVGELVHKEVNRALAESRPINITKTSFGSGRSNCAHRGPEHRLHADRHCHHRWSAPRV